MRHPGGEVAVERRPTAAQSRAGDGAISGDAGRQAVVRGVRARVEALNATGRFTPVSPRLPTWNGGKNLNPRGGLCHGHPPTAEKETPRSSTMLAGAPEALRPSGRFDYSIAIARRSEVVPNFFKLYSLLSSGNSDCAIGCAGELAKTPEHSVLKPEHQIATRSLRIVGASRTCKFPSPPNDLVMARDGSRGRKRGEIYTERSRSDSCKDLIPRFLACTNATLLPDNGGLIDVELERILRTCRARSLKNPFRLFLEK
jgi:hypothetical protein